MSSTNKDANDDFIDVVADVDMTGTSVNLIDADVDPITESNCSGRSILLVEEDGDDDPETETNCSGRSILLVEEGGDDDPETETNCSGRSILFIDDEDEPETDYDATGCGISGMVKD